MAHFIEHEARLDELWTATVLCGLLWRLVPIRCQRSADMSRDGRA